jgi:plastocyanin
VDLKVLAATAALLAAAGCGGGGGSSSSPTSPSTTPTTNAVTITIKSVSGTQSFDPNPAAVGGQQVVFKNGDSIVHHVVLNDGTIDTGDLAPGATSAVFTMPVNGTNYHCTLHPTMIGSVNPSSGGAPPACTGQYCDPGPGY